MSESDQILRDAPGVEPAPALWRLAPAADARGRALADFMMLVPGLRDATTLRRQHVLDLVHEACAGFAGRVVFVDVNLRLNVVWVTVRPELGLGHAVAQAIRARLPEAVLVGGQLKPPPRMPVIARWFRGGRRVAQRLLGRGP